jgi:preprotein translocase subunit SecG
MQNIKQILSIIQIVLAGLLIAAVLLQQRGVGLSATFGGEGNIYRTKRGLEKGLFISTIVLAILFFGAAFASFLAAR